MDLTNLSRIQDSVEVKDSSETSKFGSIEPGKTYWFFVDGHKVPALVLLKSDKNVVVCTYPESVDTEKLTGITYGSYGSGDFLDVFPEEDQETVDDAVCKWFLSGDNLMTVYNTKVEIKDEVTNPEGIEDSDEELSEFKNIISSKDNIKKISNLLKKSLKREYDFKSTVSSDGCVISYENNDHEIKK